MKLLGLLLSMVLANRAVAYDYWLEPDRTLLVPKDTAVIRLMFGETFAVGVEKPLQLGRTSEFRVYGDSRQFGNLLIHPSLKGNPAAMKRFDFPGTMMVTMERSPSQIAFGRIKFIQYAAMEGHPITEAELPITERRVLETYTRFLKTLIQVGDRITKVPQKVVDHTYEIVPKNNPYDPDVKDLRVRVMFEGKPQAGAKVSAIQRLNGNLTTVSDVTNEDGKCTLPIQHQGLWLIRTVKITQDEDSPANFHSFWAELTFGYKN